MAQYLYYQMILTSVWWNDDYKDVRRFSSAEEQETYFDLGNKFKNAQLVNFQIGNLLRPSIVFKASTLLDVFDVLNSNYAIIKNTHENSEQQYFFYFVENVKQDSANQYIFELKLDVWQTYQFIAQIGRGLIERAHLNRFRIDSTNGIGFDWRSDSPLMIEEKTTSENDKILSSRYNLSVPYRISSNERSIGEWFNNHVAGWLYIFIEGGKFYKGLKFGSTTIPETAPTQSYFTSVMAKGIRYPYAILAIPLYKPGTTGAIFYQGTDDKKIQLDDNYGEFRYYNNSYSYVYSQKVLPVNPLAKVLKKMASVNPLLPFPMYISDSKVEIDGSNNLIIHGYRTINAEEGTLHDLGADISIYASNVLSGGIYHGILCFGGDSGNYKIDDVLDQFLFAYNTPFKNWPITGETVSTLQTKFAAHTLTRNKKFNPKLYGASYRQVRLNIANQGVASFGYNQLAAGNTSTDTLLYQNENYFKARASLVPEVETLSLSPYKSQFFVNSEDYLAPFGAVLTADFSIPFNNDVYEQYLANNKNFWLQNKTKWGLEAFNVYANNIKSPDPVNLIKSGVGIGVEYFETQYQINNMQNAPDHYSAGSGSITYAMTFENEVAYYADLYISPDYVLERDDDYMYLYGFKFGKIEEFANVVNIRYYFNYVQGIFESISGSLSDAARREIFNSLASGVRFWNVDRTSFDFTLENLEHSVIDYE